MQRRACRFEYGLRYKFRLAYHRRPAEFVFAADLDSIKELPRVEQSPSSGGQRNQNNLGTMTAILLILFVNESP
jgi:hypothetical protein